MEILIKEMTLDRSELLIYLMTFDGKPIKCEMTIRENVDDIIKKFTPNGIYKPLKIKVQKYI